MVATPDHWHTKIVIEAMLAGKDVYCEKPLTLTIDEGKLIEKVVKETGRVFQVGTMQRSECDSRFLRAVALVKQGRIGKVKKVTCGINGMESSPIIPECPVPEGLDWDFWLGPAEKFPTVRCLKCASVTAVACHSSATDTIRSGTGTSIRAVNSPTGELITSTSPSGHSAQRDGPQQSDSGLVRAAV